MVSEIEKIKKTVDFIKSKSQLQPKVGLTLGSGLGSFIEKVNVKVAIPYSEIPYFNPPTVEGHSGQLVLGEIGGNPLVILQGRVHFYEGHGMKDVVFPTRVMCQLGIETLVLTNAAGGMGDNMKPGDFMIIEDHINLLGTNPLIGKNLDELGVRFPDMSHVYDKNLNIQLEKLLKEKNISYSKGVYAAMTGPSYETPAEIRFLKTIGASAVGMSTVPEAIVARHMGKKVCGLSCITNFAAGLSEETLSHDDVKDIAKRVESEFKDLLAEFLGS